MAETKRQPKLQCQTHFLPDRHVSQKMSQVYRWLVPPPSQSASLPPELRIAGDEKDGRHLHSSLF
jgi:hypothetical protein